MIKNIVFDVGDVLVEYRWKDMLMDYGLTEREAVRIGNEIFGCELWNDCLDKGTMSQEEVVQAYKERFPEDAEVIEWFITHGEYMHLSRPEIWTQVHMLKTEGYGIYLLSNYSEELFEKHTKYASFIQYVDGTMVSYQVQALKPDPKIYKCLLEKYELNAEECLFFDDRKENVDGAVRMGMQAKQVTSREMLRHELDELLQQRVKQFNHM